MLGSICFRIWSSPVQTSKKIKIYCIRNDLVRLRFKICSILFVYIRSWKPRSHRYTTIFDNFLRFYNLFRPQKQYFFLLKQLPCNICRGVLTTHRLAYLCLQCDASQGVILAHFFFFFFFFHSRLLPGTRSPAVGPMQHIYAVCDSCITSGITMFKISLWTSECSFLVFLYTPVLWHFGSWYNSFYRTSDKTFYTCFLYQI